MKIIPIKETTFVNKNIKDYICSNAFDSIAIDVNGSVFICLCEEWLPTPIGNIFNQTLVEMLSSDLANRIRQSIIDGSYRYCDETKCGILVNNDRFRLLDRTDDRIEHLTSSDNYLNPSHIMFAGDRVCNLSCPSCRTGIIKNSPSTEKINSLLAKKLAESIFSYGSDKDIFFYTSSTGEFFSSKLILNVLKNIPTNRYPNLKLSLQTNGILAKDRWNKIEHLEDRIWNFTVTADSCKKDTYEILRRGGRFEDLIDSLKFISNKQKKLNFTYTVRMVLQNLNHSEIIDFYNFYKQLGFGRFEYTRITNWGTYPAEEFKQHDVLDSSHENYSTTVNLLKTLKTLHPTEDINFLGFSL